MPEHQRSLKVFLSYASQDRAVVREFSGRLANEGWIDPWVDEKKLLPGHDWRTKIEEAVETSDIVIICLSSNSVTKEGFVQKELRYAREIAFEKPDETIFLIPLRLDDCTVPRGLRFYQWGDYFGEKKEETYADLLESLKLRHEQKLKFAAEELTRKEKAEKERIALEEKARKEAEEKARLEAEERAQREKEERERKAAEAKARKEAEEKARQEAEERARSEKEEKERKAAEIAAQEKEKREVAEKANREKAERRAAQIATLKESLSNSFAIFISNLPRAIRRLRIAGCAGITIVLFWVGWWGFPKITSLLPIAKATATLAPRPSDTFTALPKLPTQTQIPQPSTSNIVFILDISGSLLQAKSQNVQLAMSNFVSSLSSAHEVSLITYGKYVIRQIDLTKDHAAVNEKIQSLTFGSGDVIGGSCTYDALYAGIDYLALFPPPAGKENSIILLTEGSGGICNPIHAGGDVLGLAAQHPVSIFTVDIGGNDMTGYLRNMSFLTGGESFSSHLDGTGMDQILRSISEKAGLELNDSLITSTPEPSPSPTVNTLTQAALPAEITDAKGVSMVLVPASEFTMGYLAESAYNFCLNMRTNIVNFGRSCQISDYQHEEPIHKVYLDDYFVDVFEVSNGDYKKCVSSGDCLPPSSNNANGYSSYYNNEFLSNYPVLNVTWEMAMNYCEWRGTRLPTEAEWEKAARGIDERLYPWSNSSNGFVFEPVFYSNRANVNLNPRFSISTVPVSSNSKGLSPYGLYNMAGNVSEWVYDWYSETYYLTSPYENPTGPTSGDYKVFRGGSVNDYDVRTTARGFLEPINFNAGVGFRCAKDANP